MNDKLKNCIKEDDNRAVMVFSEKGVEYRAKNKNKKHLQKLHIDGELIQDEKRCDYGMIVEAENLYLIELKGSNREDACEQLLSTYDFFSKNIPMKSYHCRISLGKVVSPEIRHSNEKRIIQLKNSGEISFEYRKTPFEEIV